MTRGGGDLTSTDTHVTLNDPPCGLLWYENRVFMSYLSALHHACCAAAHTDMTRPISFSRARNVTQDTLSVFAQNRVKRYTVSHDHKAVGFKSLNVPMQQPQWSYSDRLMIWDSSYCPLQSALSARSHHVRNISEGDTFHFKCSKPLQWTLIWKETEGLNWADHDVLHACGPLIWWILHNPLRATTQSIHH